MGDTARHALLMTCLMVGAMMAQVPPTDAAYPGTNGRIAFEAQLVGGPGDDQGKLYTIKPDGTGLRQVTDFESHDPAWSPDGTRIAFGYAGIQVVKPDGSNLRHVTPWDKLDAQPSWSPTGMQIAFARGLVTPCNPTCKPTNYEIFVVNVDGSELQRLTYEKSADLEPSWSPDGTKIAFVATHRGNSDIWVMNADGSNVVRLTRNPAEDGGPAWSPDGIKMAFWSTRDGNAEIYVMDADGSREARITNDSAEDTGPAWSPDGTKIAFASNRAGSGSEDIWVMNADGTGAYDLTGPVTRTIAVETFPGWQTLPQGQT